MQKVLRRAERAKRTADRQKARSVLQQEKEESWNRNQNRVRLLKEQNDLIRQERKNRIHDWETGALAPRRDVGDLAKTYATMGVYNWQLPEKDPKDQPKWIHISEGDRVVMLKGRDRGRIGRVRSVDPKTVAVSVEGLNLVDISIPEWLKQENQNDRDMATQARSVPLEDVKLVYPLPDPKTGAHRDVIIDRLLPVNRHWDKNLKEWDDGDRVIPGTNMLIPWPEKADPDYEDHESDSLRISVEEQTFRPFLIRPPMPLSVIDELRGKYSRFRTRHDYDYVVKKEMQEAKESDRKNLIKTMRTPLQELADLRAKQRQEQPKELTPEQLAKIGEVIAREQAKGADVAKEAGV
ncbi:hypothetical protein M409DRAFT_66375 [Zasmidium cellare ATCC 36951]|uniref:KOW domain-containing protein n=1 Tax=Zasmidium cellare ATCC 36951 TaxID=1080233 RepID=A0A6A6CMY0_ZASCE|nr:uncharacterized protein M409DRAFT_66375 [Zasmidium cellare ATCC 36951]KAF2166806.1 hypothetical protein M409DRAFT_66375 [Zasmidium cellare ATCC 36951]